jgi:glutamyl-tRNA synthetase
MQYDEQGYLPEAVLNYLARLGWSHGDAEVFSMEEFCAWFDLDHITASAAQFNTEKLNWLNAHYLKQADDAWLASEVLRRLGAQGVQAEPTSADLDLPRVCGLYKDRVANLNELADAVHPFLVSPHPGAELKAQHLTETACAALATLRDKLAAVSDWQASALSQAIKETTAAHGLKMPQVAIPLRVALLGQPQSPSIDAVLAVMGQARVLARLARQLEGA